MNLLFAIFLLLCSLSRSTLCESNTDLLSYHVVKDNSTSSLQFSILSDEHSIFKETLSGDQNVLSSFTCIPYTNKNNYVLQVIVSEDSDFSGSSHVTLYGLYDDLLLSIPVYRLQTNTSIFLHNSIKKGENWSFHHISIPITWMESNFDSSLWAVYTDSSSFQTTGNQFFRKVIMGKSSSLPPAYLAKFRYSHGIIVYLNGRELFRDNLSDGVISPTAHSTASYPSLDYRGTIRSSSDLKSTTLVIAVGLFFPAEPTVRTVSFDGYLQELSSSLPNAYVLSEGVSITSFSCKDNVIDQLLSTGCLIQSNEALDLVMPESVLPVLSGFQVNFDTQMNGVPDSIKVEGLASDSSQGSLIGLFHWNATKQSDLLVFENVFSGYKRYRIHFQSDGSNSSSGGYFINEIYPLVMQSVNTEMIPYPQTTFSFQSGLDPINIHPHSGQYHNCTVIPALPEGLKLHSDCSLVGYPLLTTGISQFTVLSSHPPAAAGMTFFSQQCAGHRLHFHVQSVDSTKQMTVLVTAAGTVVWSYDSLSVIEQDALLCVEANRLHIRLGKQPWPAGSLFTIAKRVNSQDIVIYNGVFSTMMSSSNEVDLDILMPILPASTWSYHSNVQSIPDHWYSVFHEDWPLDFFPFEAPETPIQLYQKKFTIATIDSINTIQIGIRFRYGCILYLNDKVVYRQGLDEMSPSTPIADFGEVVFTETSIPFMATSGQSMHSLVHVGENMLSVVLVSPPSYIQSDFDCYLYINTQDIVLQNVEYTAQLRGDNADAIFSMDQNQIVEWDSAVNETIQLQFAKHRRVFLNHITLSSSIYSSKNGPTALNVYGFNPGELSEPVLVYSTSSIVYWELGQTKQLRFPSSKAYNIYRFEIPHPSSVQLAIGLHSERQTFLPTCQYYTTITAYLHASLPEVLPACSYYSSFTSDLPLPSGLKLDSVSGVINGIPTEVVQSNRYSISAKAYNQEAVVTFIITLSVLACYENEMIDLQINVSNAANPGQQSLEIHGTNFEFLRTHYYTNEEPTSNWVVCVPPGTYNVTMSFGSNGWNAHSGYFINLLQSKIPLATDLIEKNTTLTIPLLIHCPLRHHHAIWSYYMSNKFLDDSWKGSIHDMTEWKQSQGIDYYVKRYSVLYLKATLDVETIQNETVLYIVIHYQGGFIAYFNNHVIGHYFYNRGEMMANSDDLSIKIAHITVPLERVDYQVGKNILAIELFKPNSIEKLDYLHFDLFAMFGYDEYALLIDDFVEVTCSQGKTSDYCWKVFDFDIRSFDTIRFTKNSFVDFSFVNQEVIAFNHFGMQMEYQDAFDWVLRGGYYIEKFLYELSSGSFSSVHLQAPEFTYTPAGFLRYNSFSFLIQSTTHQDTMQLHGFNLYYRTNKGIRCKEEGWPFVYDLEYSAIPCNENYEGLIYRTCVKGQFGPPIASRCVLHEVTFLSYNEHVDVIREVDVGEIQPFYNYKLSFFSITPPLLAGLSMDPQTGIITGSVVDKHDNMTFTVTGMNERSVVKTTFTINVKNAACMTDNIPYQLGSVRIDECDPGEYWGKIQRTCMSRGDKVQWVETKNTCVPLSQLIIISSLIILVIIILLIVFYIVVNSCQKEEVEMQQLRKRRIRVIEEEDGNQ